MDLFKDWNIVPLDLELAVDFNFNVIDLDDENYERLISISEKVRGRIKDSYPQIDLLKGLSISDYYEGKSRGPTLTGQTSRIYFKRIFGSNIKRGFLFYLLHILILFHVIFIQNGIRQGN